MQAETRGKQTCCQEGCVCSKDSGTSAEADWRTVAGIFIHLHPSLISSTNALAELKSIDV